LIEDNWRLGRPDREAAIAIIEQADLTNVEGLVEAMRHIMVAVARGALDPVTSAELRAWCELTFAAISAVQFPAQETSSPTMLLQAFIGQTVNAEDAAHPPLRTAFSRTADNTADIVEADQAMLEVKVS
jgi:hypothetical protein